MKLFLYLRNVIRFKQLPVEKRRLTFYSEGKNYWPYLGRIIQECLLKHNLQICYISSDTNDPGLKYKHPNYNTFLIDEGFVRDWLFANIQTEIMVMTMPDLNQYQVKRSCHKVHYVYLQHSLVSLHMVYRKGAFDHYDTIFCAGPHHITEIRAMEKKYNLPAKNLIQHGYARLDEIAKMHDATNKKSSPQITPEHILIAPSWGPHCIIESGIGIQIIDQLIENGYTVSLRPHPQTCKFASNKIQEIVNKYSNHPKFNIDNNVADQESLHSSDCMITDWSGVSLDYAFGMQKPVIFIDVPRKINNHDYEEIDIEPFESSIRDKIGTICAMQDASNLNIADYVVKKDLASMINNHVYNFKCSDKAGANALMQLLSDVKNTY
jgi:hypothetical protein